VIEVELMVGYAPFFFKFIFCDDFDLILFSFLDVQLI